MFVWNKAGSLTSFNPKYACTHELQNTGTSYVVECVLLVGNDLYSELALAATGPSDHDFCTDCADGLPNRHSHTIAGVTSDAARLQKVLHPLNSMYMRTVTASIPATCFESS